MPQRAVRLRVRLCVGAQRLHGRASHGVAHGALRLCRGPLDAHCAGRFRIAARRRRRWHRDAGVQNGPLLWRRRRPTQLGEHAERRFERLPIVVLGAYGHCVALHNDVLRLYGGAQFVHCMGAAVVVISSSVTTRCRRRGRFDCSSGRCRRRVLLAWALFTRRCRSSRGGRRRGVHGVANGCGDAAQVRGDVIVGVGSAAATTTTITTAGAHLTQLQ